MNNYLRLVAPLLLLSLAGCWPETQWTDLRGGSTDCLVVLFSEETTTQEIDAFLKEHTHGPPHPGGGFTLRAGINAVVRREVEGQTGYEICFRRGVDLAEKSLVRDGVMASSLPAHVLEGKEAEEVVYGESRAVRR
jgi:hypothetical protein